MKDTIFLELKRQVKGEVRFDKYSRILYSTDASIYQIEPIGVVVPQDAEDAHAVVLAASRDRVPILPRGGGTSLAGQAVGEAIIIDFAKYMNRILEVNTEERWVRVQPGVVQDELNDHLRRYGFMFGPDTASANRATIGGMIGNNSAGAHSILYGKTVDHVKELRVLLSNGEEAVLGELSSSELEAKLRGSSLQSRIYREIRRIVEDYSDEILARYPRIMRRVSGYNLDELVKPNGFNLAKLIVGSEGTLATVIEAKLKIEPRPKMTALDVVHFRDLIEAVEASQEIVACGPAAAEVTDKMVLDLARRSLEYSRLMGFVEGDPGALMIVEFYGDSEDELRRKLYDLEERLKRKRMGYAFVRALDPLQQANIWKVRKASLGLLMGVKGERKPIAFVEDPAVPLENLPEFLRRFKKILDEHNTTGGYYGHASVGCLHIRPLINLKEAFEVEKMRSIAEQICDLVIEFGGSMSGEHGDGLARSHFNEKLFGPRLYRAFQEVKAAFDPENIMNPGKIVNAPPMTENLRYGPKYRAMRIETHLDFSREGGFAAAIEQCNGAGVCRKRLDGTMCPSFMVTREEEHSTRGRANALRAVLSGLLPPEEFTSRRLYQVLDLCLECKGCKAECPSNVDMAKLKYEFLAHYYGKHGTPLRARIFGNLASLNRLGCLFAPASNWILRSSAIRWALERIAGIDRRRQLPPFARQTFDGWFRRHKPSVGALRYGQVVLFNDCFTNYNYPEIGRAATELLERAGIEVILVRTECCGRPMISKGMLEKARRCAEANVERLSRYVRRGYMIVGCEPSCLLTLRDEYLDLVKGDEVKRVAESALLVDEYLYRLHMVGRLNLRFSDRRKRILFHGHCHQKALVGTRASLSVLRLPQGFEVNEVDSGCCGMAGSFGYEKEHYDISLAIGGRRLFPAILASGGEVEIVASGVSCRQQIAHGTGCRARHPVEVLLEAL